MQYLKFETIDGDYYEYKSRRKIKHGSRVANSRKRIEHTGVKYPDCIKPKSKIKLWLESGRVLYLEMDITSGKAASIVNQDAIFKAQIMDKAEADAFKLEKFGYVESGVTE